MMMTDGVKRDPRLLAPPWRERGPDGKLGPEYGPKTAATYAKHVAQHRDWSYRTPSKESRGADLDAIRDWIRLEDGTIRLDVPEGEARVYLAIEQGDSVRSAARRLGISRESVRSYLRRLKARALRSGTGPGNID